MTAAATKLPTEGAFLECGRIEGAGRDLQVRLDSGCYSATRAKSCLVAPDLGDRVLCAIERDAVFVLAVLEGRPGAATRLQAEGELRVQAPAGRISLSSGCGVDVVGANDVAITSGELSVRAKRGAVAVQELGFLGRAVQAQASKVSLVAEQLDTRLTRWLQRAKRVFRFVEEIDQVRAGTVDVRAESLAAVRGENTVVSARVLAKIDGEQVHIG